MTTRKLIVIGSLVLVLLLAVALSFSVSPRADQSQDNQNTYGRPTDSFYDFMNTFVDRELNYNPYGMPIPENYHTEVYPDLTTFTDLNNALQKSYFDQWVANEEKYLKSLEEWYKTPIVVDSTGKSISTFDYFYQKFNDTWANYHQEFYNEKKFTDDSAPVPPPATLSFDSFMVSCYSDSHNRPVKTPPDNAAPNSHFNRLVRPTEDTELIQKGIDTKGDDGKLLSQYAGFYNSCVDTYNKRNPDRNPGEKITKDQLLKARTDYKNSKEYKQLLEDRKAQDADRLDDACTTFNTVPGLIETAHAQSTSECAPTPGIDGNPDVSDTPEPQATE